MVLISEKTDLLTGINTLNIYIYVYIYAYVCVKLLFKSDNETFCLRYKYLSTA